VPLLKKVHSSRSIEREVHHPVEKKNHECKFLRSSEREKYPSRKCANNTLRKQEHPQQIKHVLKRPSINRTEKITETGMAISFDQRN
jgi:hypothetical protein